MSGIANGVRPGAPDGWTTIDLGAVAGSNGLFVDGDWILSDDLKTGKDVRLLQLGDIGVGRFLDKSSKWISRTRSRELNCTEVLPGDILISRMAHPIARACIVPNLGVTCITAVDVTICRANLEDVEPRYVMHALNSPGLRAQAEKQASGTTRKRITRKKLEMLRLPVPPLPEQKRIVRGVEDLSTRLDTGAVAVQEMLRRLEHLRLSLFQSVVVEGDERQVGDLLDGIEAGKSFKCHGRPAGPGEWGVIKVSAMTTGTFDQHENKAVLSEDDADPRWEIKPGDLLISRANTSKYVGASAFVEQTRNQLLLSDKSLRLHVSEAVDPAWLQMALSAPTCRAQMSESATGTSDSMRNLSQDKIRAVRLRVPTPDRQADLVSSVRQRLRIIAAGEAEVKRAVEQSGLLREAIFDRAFRGELICSLSEEPAAITSAVR